MDTVIRTNADGIVDSLGDLRPPKDKPEKYMADIEVAVRSLAMFVAALQDDAGEIRIECMPSSFKTLQRISQRLQNALRSLPNTDGADDDLELLASARRRAAEPAVDNDRLRRRNAGGAITSGPTREHTTEQLEAISPSLYSQGSSDGSFSPPAGGMNKLRAAARAALQAGEQAERRAEAAERELALLKRSLSMKDVEDEIQLGSHRIENRRHASRVKEIEEELISKRQTIRRLQGALQEREEQLSAVQAELKRSRNGNDPTVRGELAVALEKLSVANRERDEMKIVWEQLLEGNARLRRENAMLEGEIISHANEQEILHTPGHRRALIPLASSVSLLSDAETTVMEQSLTKWQTKAATMSNPEALRSTTAATTPPRQIDFTLGGRAQSQSLTNASVSTIDGGGIDSLHM